jgi:hypothetical protein
VDEEKQGRIKANQNITNSGESSSLNQIFDSAEDDEATLMNEDGEAEEKSSSVAAALKASQSMKKALIGNEDEDEETFESVYGNLPGDLKNLKESMYKAQGCCLLLILKQFLKEIYTITDLKIQNYSPNDTAKVNDRPITGRKTNRKFNPKQIMDYLLRMESYTGADQNSENEELKRSLVTEYLEVYIKIFVLLGGSFFYVKLFLVSHY